MLLVGINEILKLTTMAVQVAVYALLKTAIEVEILLSSERHYSDSSPVSDMYVCFL